MTMSFANPATPNKRVARQSIMYFFILMDLTSTNIHKFPDGDKGQPNFGPFRTAVSIICCNFEAIVELSGRINGLFNIAE